MKILIEKNISDDVENFISFFNDLNIDNIDKISINSENENS